MLFDRLQKTRKYLIVFSFVLIATAFLFSITPPLLSHLLSNYGMVFLLHRDRHATWVEYPDKIYNAFQAAVDWQNDNEAAYRGLGHHYWSVGDDTLANQAWQRAALTVNDYLIFAQTSDQITTRFRWYQIALATEPQNPAVWLNVGLSCRSDITMDALCSRFREQNKQNLLVDSAFAFGEIAWHSDQREGMEFRIVDCPDFATTRCAEVVIQESATNSRGGWQQCFSLPSGGDYHYSAWIKVEAEELEQWRPLYFQGRLNGDVHGVGQAVQLGASDWRYWESTFTLPAFERDQVCFRPILLQGIGRAWFHSAVLQPVGE